MHKSMKCSLSLLVLFTTNLAVAQFSSGFPERPITLADLEMKSYPKDTLAHAVVLSEFGLAYIDDEGDNNLLLDYEIKIKILSKEGVDEANFKIPLRKGDTGKEKF